MPMAATTDVPAGRGRITFVIGSLDYGGAERHLVQILPGLAARGWQVEVFTLSAPGAQAPVLAAHGIKVMAPPMAPRPGNIVYRVLRLVTTALAFGAHLLKAQPDAVHFFLPQAYLVGGLVSLLTGPRHRLMSRRSRNFYQARHGAMARIERWLHRRMSAVLGNSRPVVDDLVAEGVPPERLGLIHNGIDLTPFAAPAARADMRAALGIGGDELVLAKLANLIAYKGHEDLLRGLARARLPERWRLVCIGRNDGILPGLEALARELGIADNIIWLGGRTDIPALLAAADIGVLASHEEGFSNAVLEYMASGLPALVTDVGGNGEAVIEGVTGLVVPARDPAAMSLALERLADAQVRAAMGQAGRARVAAEFSLDRCVAKYDELYGAILANRGLSMHLRADNVLSSDTGGGGPH